MLVARGKGGNGDEIPPPPPGNCPSGGDHNYVLQGHDYVCTKCGARTSGV